MARRLAKEEFNIEELCECMWQQVWKKILDISKWTATVPGSAPVFLQASAGDKSKVAVLMLRLRDLLMA